VSNLNFRQSSQPKLRCPDVQSNPSFLLDWVHCPILDLTQNKENKKEKNMCMRHQVHVGVGMKKGSDGPNCSFD